MRIDMSLIARFDGNMNVISKLLKEYRMKQNMSYETLSAKLELMGISIHKQSLYDIENNKRTVKDYELFGIAHLLGIDVNDLLKDIIDKFQIQNQKNTSASMLVFFFGHLLLCHISVNLYFLFSDL